MGRINDLAPVQKLSRLNFFSKWEAAELPKLLMPDEQVLAVLSGFYTSGTAILCVTSKRLLLVDKKLMRLSFEDIRFDSIKEVNYSHQAFIASVKFYFAGRELQFRSWYRNELRMLAQFVQQKMFESNEKRHYKAPESQMHSGQHSLQQQVQPIGYFESKNSERPNHAAPAASTYQNNPHLEKYLNERIARWRRANRFINNLTMATKTGRQVLDLELPKN